MKVKILVSMSGHRFAVNPGDVVLVDDDEGQRLVDAGFARALSDKARETAVMRSPDAAVQATPETADQPPGETR